MVVVGVATDIGWAAPFVGRPRRIGVIDDATCSGGTVLYMFGSDGVVVIAGVGCDDEGTGGNAASL